MKCGLRNRLAQIETKSRAMARSGKYRSHAAIEMALLAQGFAEAHIVFANRWSQSELDRLCDQARSSQRGLHVMRGRAA
jgi:hypothetical protein